ncbi:N-acetylmuramoyl-L-alanine amidase [Dyella jiangningensis]|uniref:N-acetylmuramoyl-L-alanine amidase n=1 Tax=Dyella sp. AtDHG13 TaxID=1938897 RepID=UPI000889BE1D|nr:N-acetylmuramoyl-L-alanine amidase [Dyella sp. AtDHG13]PXV58521.1 N-acetylmuramoyl-L-alanine amidase [Dyella sp. AtDHG13]SDL17075.1 N-acetylmuramoyl-L-alanine amidase [Dyella jiangningensis]
MKGLRTHPALLGAVALLAVAPFCVARAADVKSARVWAGPEYTRVVLDVSGPVTYKLNQDGGELTVDVNASSLASSFSSPGATGLYKGISGERQGNNVRLTAKIDPSSTVKSFLLKPQADYGYRLVVDLYPGNGNVATRSAPVKTSAPPPAPSEDDRDSDNGATAAAAVTPPPAPVQTPVPAPEPVRSTGKSSLKPTQSGMASTRAAAALLNGERKVVIAIDAGHGGEDPGAHGPGGTLEKNVTLAVARQLAEQINQQPGMRAVLTRNADFFIPLAQRYQIARNNSADLFVSIHADAFINGDAKGSSVWVLSPRGKTSMAARWLADGQNRADLIGGVTLDDKNDGLAAVLLDLQQGYSMQASESVAGNVLKALGSLGPTHRGYVERANFVVLRSPDVPSILVETAFISNPDEERKLRDPSHQSRLATAVMGGIRSYFESTPPPGSWFAAQASRRNGVANVASSQGDDDTSAKATRAVAQAMASSSNASSRADDGVQDLHRVERGESLRSIAKQYGVSINALKTANKLDSDSSVRVGMMLAIPAG